MHPESAVNLVSGALQSSLTRAQKNYKFHGEKSSHNSEEKKLLRKEKKANNKLSEYCETIGSKFASYSVSQLEEIGNKQQYINGGFLPPAISKELKKKYTVLSEDVGPLAGVVLPDYNWKDSGNSGGSDTESNCKPEIKSKKKSPTEVPNEGEKICDNSFKSEDLTERLVKSNKIKIISGPQSQQKTASVTLPVKIIEKDTILEKLLKQIKDKTIGKSKRKRLCKKYSKLKKLQAEKSSVESLDVDETLNQLQVNKQSKKNKLINLASNLVGFGLNKNQPVVEEKQNLLKTNKSNKLSKRSMGPGNGASPVVNGLSSSSNHQLPQPKRILFPKEKVVLGWRQRRGPGVGFHNFGNTCYLNSSLQALFHIPAFVNWLQNEEEHRAVCNGSFQSTCIICVVYSTLQDHSKSNSPIRPRVLDKLRAICKHFSYGRQEDAHEFLRYLLEGMERSYLTAINGLRLDNRTKETNPLGQIFGGYIRTEVTCVRCNSVSTTFQPSSELQLDIRHSTTLEDALHHHFRKERLDNNDYKCEKCRTTSDATKQFSLEVPPLVLCLQLKRFTLYGTKITKRIHCNRYLNMARFIHRSRRQFIGDQEMKYRLVALVTHIGQSQNSGHYTSIAEGCNGMYYQFDDQFVHQVSQQNALNNDAYVIIYEMDRVSRPALAEMTTDVSTPACSSLASNQKKSDSNPSSLPKPSTITSAMINGAKKFTIPFAKGASNGTNDSALRSSVMASSNPKINGSNLNLDHKLINFSLQKSVTSTVSNPTQPNKINILKPGVALTNSSKMFPPPSATVVTKSPVKLVPYNDVENDDSDKEDHVVAQVKCNGEKEKETPELNKKKVIGVSEQQLLLTPPKSPMAKSPSSVSKNSPATSPTPSANKNSPATSPSLSVNRNSLEKTYGVKRKLDELFGPVVKSKGNLGVPSKTKLDECKEPVLNATSKWTIVANKGSNGYSSDPESSKLNKDQTKFKPVHPSRAKSMERILPKTNGLHSQTAQPCPPLVPNTNKTKGITEHQSSASVTSPTKFSKPPIETVVVNGHTDKPSIRDSVKINGHHHSSSPSIKKRKRSRSRSSSSSSSVSSSSESKKRRKKHLKRKKDVKEKKRNGKKSSADFSGSRSSSSDSEDSGHYRKRSEKKSKSKKRHNKSKEGTEDSRSGTREDSLSRSLSRETDSEERDRIRRKARNPSRSPLRAGDSADSVKKNIDPSKINDRDKSIVGWGGQQSLLSKTIQDDKRREILKTGDELFDEEMDQGRTKKLRKSNSPSRETNGDGNKFQSLQDKKALVNQWSSMLDGYGAGFKDHKTSPGGKKPWEKKPKSEKEEGRPHQKFSPKTDRYSSSSSSSYSSSNYRNNHRSNGGGYTNFNGNRNHSHHEDKNWKHKNRR